MAKLKTSLSRNSLSMANEKQKDVVVDSEIEIQRVQALMSYFQTRVNISYSIRYGFIVGYLIFLATLFFQGTIYSQLINLKASSELASILNLFIFMILAYTLVYFMKPRIIQLNAQRDNCLKIVDELFQKINQGIPIPSLIELKECQYPAQNNK